jgi:hypothetical protein
VALGKRADRWDGRHQGRSLDSSSVSLRAPSSPVSVAKIASLLFVLLTKSCAPNVITSMHEDSGGAYNQYKQLGACLIVTTLVGPGGLPLALSHRTQSILSTMLLIAACQCIMSSPGTKSCPAQTELPAARRWCSKGAARLISAGARPPNTMLEEIT